MPTRSGRPKKMTSAALVRFIMPVCAILAFGQETKPDFTGTWKSVSISRGSVAPSITEIHQTAATFSIRVKNSNAGPTDWATYPIDGKKSTETVRRQRIERTGHWEGNHLILEETGPGNTPWRRSTERRIISPSENGSVITIQIHNVSDTKGLRDYSIQLQKLPLD